MYRLEHSSNYTIQIFKLIYIYYFECHVNLMTYRHFYRYPDLIPTEVNQTIK